MHFKQCNAYNVTRMRLTITNSSIMHYAFKKMTPTLSDEIKKLLQKSDIW